MTTPLLFVVKKQNLFFKTHEFNSKRMAQRLSWQQFASLYAKEHSLTYGQSLACAAPAWEDYKKKMGPAPPPSPASSPSSSNPKKIVKKVPSNQSPSPAGKKKLVVKGKRGGEKEGEKEKERGGESPSSSSKGETKEDVAMYDYEEETRIIRRRKNPSPQKVVQEVVKSPPRKRKRKSTTGVHNQPIIPTEELKSHLGSFPPKGKEKEDKKEVSEPEEGEIVEEKEEKEEKEIEQKEASGDAPPIQHQLQHPGTRGAIGRSKKIQVY